MFRPRLRPASIRTARAAWANMGGAAAGMSGMSGRRMLHTVPPLPFDDGIPGFLSKEGFDTAYTRYHQMQLDYLNRSVAESALENTFTKELVILLSRDPAGASLFNAASMAHNNHFFFDSIAKLPVYSRHVDRPVASQSVESMPIPQHLNDALTKNFSSVATFRQYFLGTALGMFGPGFVWLVKTDQSHLKILCTYLAGTPYRKAHHKRQGLDTNNVTVNHEDAASTFEATKHAHNPAQDEVPGGVDVTPLMCLNTWEHVWLHDYGIYHPEERMPAGKERYITNWWKVINWDKVADRYDSNPGYVTRKFKR